MGGGGAVKREGWEGLRGGGRSGEGYGEASGSFECVNGPEITLRG